MLSALLRFPKSQRRQVASVYGKRSQATHRRKRIDRGPSFETIKWRAKDDRRGIMVREGHLYRGDGRVQFWRIIYSVNGRSDQYDITLDGAHWETGGPERIAELMPGIVLPSAR